MKTIAKLLAVLFTLTLLYSGVQSPVQAGTIQHRFMIELPNGERVPLSGGPVVQSVFKDHSNESGDDKLHVSQYCWYKGKGGDDTEHMQRLSDGYQCVTPSGCDYATWHSPMFPAGFNKSGDVYQRVEIENGRPDGINDSEMTETTHATFDPEKKTFTERYPWAAQYFNAGEPLGGEHFYWQGDVQGRSDSFRIVDGTKPSDTLKGPIGDGRSPGGRIEDYVRNMDQYWTKVFWRKYNGNSPVGNGESMGDYDQKNVTSWSNGAVLYNGVGRNQLHGAVTWVLKNRIPVQIDKPTAKLGSVCQPQTWNGPLSYKFTISNIDLKGQPFLQASIHIGFTYDANSAKIRQFLGKSTWEPDNWQPKNGDWFAYQIKSYSSYNGGNLEFIWDANTKIGSNQKTIDELVAAFPASYYVSANLSNGTNQRSGFNDNIGHTMVKVTKNACATPPPSPSPVVVGPICADIDMQNMDGQTITNYAGLKPGDRVKFLCKAVSGVNQYAFRVVKFDAQFKQVGTPVSLNVPDTNKPNVSGAFTIPAEGGKFYAQCALCPSGKCQAFEPASYVPAPSTGGNTGSTACASPNSCVTPAGCLTQATGNFSCPVSGQVCCSNRRRDE